jgi:hypothetical protein
MGLNIMRNDRSRHAAWAAAAVNGVVVLVLAPALYWRMSTSLASTAIVTAALVSSPYAALTAWRTWVYATRRIGRLDSGWRGVLEAGATGLLTALAYFAPMIARGDLRVVAPVLVYSVFATAIGLLLGCALRALALIVLMLFRLIGPREI